MLTILIILVAILATGALAYLIANKVSKKARPIISIVLWLLVIFLGYKIYQGIMGPIIFNKEKVARYTPVIKNLKTIRDAEIAHKEVTGNYTANKANLITFIDTAKFAVTETKNIVVTVNKGTDYSPIMIEEEQRVVDTIGYKEVRASFAGRDYKNMFKVPGTDAEFDLKTGFVEKVQGVRSPVFLAQIAKETVLNGLPNHLVRQEKEALAPEVTGEFISVGSLDDVKTNGNWPIIYDTGELQNKQ
tara:strand:+ start:51352 stop:52089 length:738 start_codon:yes stop_codon:yes gene_type:complete